MNAVEKAQLRYIARHPGCDPKHSRAVAERYVRFCESVREPARPIYRRGSDVSHLAEKAYWSDDIPF